MMTDGKMKIHVRSVLRLLMTLAVSIGLIFILQDCLNAFVSNPTYTEMTMVDQKKSSLPVITLCPKPGYKDDVLKVIVKIFEDLSSLVADHCIVQEHGISPTSDYLGTWQKAPLSWTSFIENVTSQELFDLSTFRFDELISWITVWTVEPLDENYVCAKYVSSENRSWSPSYPCSNSTFFEVTEQRGKWRGKCWTVALKNEYKQRGIKRLNLQT